MRTLLAVLARVLPSVALALSFAAVPADSEGAGFDGAYKLTLTFGASCQTRVPSVSIVLTLRESAVAQGSEVTGRPTRADDSAVAGITLLHAGTVVHGPFSTQGGLTQRAPITSGEGWLFMPWLVLDGTVTTTADRPQARGTAFGFLAAGEPDEDYPSSLARCTATDFSWALDPQ
jgi:hypothetical protein